jgi:hypothetical protein
MQNHNTRIEEPNTTIINCEEAANLQEIKTYVLLRQFTSDQRVQGGRNFDAGSANRIL